MTRFIVIVILAIIAVLQCNCEIDSNSEVIPKGLIQELCYNFQKYEVLFNDQCHLEFDNIETQFDDFYDFIRKKDGDVSVDELVDEIFTDSTDFFEQQYPYFKNDLNKFQQNVKTMYTKFKKFIRNTTVQEVIDVAKIMTNAYKNITTNPKKTCKTDETICPVLEAMFRINVDVAPDLTLDIFLNTTKNNILNFLRARHDDGLGFEEILLKGLISSLAYQGTLGTNIKKLRQLVITNFYKFLRMLKTYTPEVTPPPIVTKPIKVKTTKIAVTLAVYVSVPLVMIAVGVVVCVLIIVLVYRMKPVKGGSTKTKPSEPTAVTEVTDKV